jgi:hypothetical protein
MYVPEHHTLPDIRSKVSAPSGLPITFDLTLVWAQQTFDSPHQLWRATSDYNLKVCGFVGTGNEVYINCIMVKIISQIFIVNQISDF